MKKIKIIPCLVVDPNGETNAYLVHGQKAIGNRPDWRCNKVECKIRIECSNGEIGDAYRLRGVRIGKIDKEESVISCEEINMTKRRLP